MKTIKWLVSLVPESSKALFACLLISVVSLSTVIVKQDRKITKMQEDYNAIITNLTVANLSKVDSLNKVIFIIKDDSKQEALQSLERIITEQKRVIEEQKKLMEKKKIN